MDRNMGQRLSQNEFDKIMRRIHVMKQKAVAGNDPDAWGDADEVYWRLLRLNEALIIEGTMRERLAPADS
jgi:hypothetical protein